MSEAGGRRFSVGAGDADVPASDEMMGQFKLGDDLDSFFLGRLKQRQGSGSGAGNDEIGGKKCLQLMSAYFKDNNPFFPDSGLLSQVFLILDLADRHPGPAGQKES